MTWQQCSLESVSMAEGGLSMVAAVMVSGVLCCWHLILVYMLVVQSQCDEICLLLGLDVYIFQILLYCHG
ncbi:unnamed protein product [Camellia sinensis]